MTAIPQMECCTMLGIDPKTLRNWLRHAHLHFVAHPTDARLKCLTREQVQQLATLHARPIAPLAAASPVLRQEATPLLAKLCPPPSIHQTAALLLNPLPLCSKEEDPETVVAGWERKL